MRAFRVAYDGAAYHGFQRQPTVSTVEGVLLEGLVELELFDEPMDPPECYSAAGRTDAGVSALSQTIALPVPEWVTPSVVNGQLPEDIRLWSMADVPSDFHATHDAVSRTYEYVLHLDRDAIDIERLEQALISLAGEHDFHNLSADDTGTDRVLETDLDVEDTFAVLLFTADGFPRQLVRRAVTLATDVATGERPLADIGRLLDGPPVDGPDGIAPASPQPLILTSVRYPTIAFEADRDALEATRIAFTRRQRCLETRASVSDRIASGLTDTQ